MMPGVSHEQQAPREAAAGIIRSFECLVIRVASREAISDQLMVFVLCTL